MRAHDQQFTSLWHGVLWFDCIASGCGFFFYILKKVNLQITYAKTLRIGSIIPFFLLISISIWLITRPSPCRSIHWSSSSADRWPMCDWLCFPWRLQGINRCSFFFLVLCWSPGIYLTTSYPWSWNKSRHKSWRPRMKKTRWGQYRALQLNDLVAILLPLCCTHDLGQFRVKLKHFHLALSPCGIITTRPSCSCSSSSAE